MQSSFWDERYAEDEFAYGEEPNVFLKEILPNLKRGTILFPCEGEGRNAVFATEKAWQVYAFDFSSKAKQKAMKLAAKRFVKFDYQISNVEDYFYKSQFDAVALFFTHFPIEFQTSYYNKFISSLKMDGYLIGELFAEDQLDYQKQYQSGGPANTAMLASKEKMINWFPEIDFKILSEQEVELDEGPYHQGKARTIRFLGKKKTKETFLAKE